MRHSRRPYAPPPTPPLEAPPAAGRWERVSIYLEAFGFGVLFLAGLIAAVWGAIGHLFGGA